MIYHPKRHAVTEPILTGTPKLFKFANFTRKICTIGRKGVKLPQKLKMPCLIGVTPKILFLQPYN